jgi:hypothetical protein
MILLMLKTGFTSLYFCNIKRIHLPGTKAICLRFNEFGIKATAGLKYLIFNKILQSEVNTEIRSIKFHRV